MKISLPFLLIFSFLTVQTIFAVPQLRDRPFKIISKPQPERALCGTNTRTVLVEVTFDATDIVTGAKVKKESGCAEFDQNVIRAAHMIQFEAEIKHGKPVTVVKKIEYTFSTY